MNKLATKTKIKKPALYMEDVRMLELMEWAIKHGKAADAKDYCEKIGFPRTNLSAVRRGLFGFTRDQISNACELTGANANWIFGFEPNMFRIATAADPLEQFQQSAAVIEHLLRKAMKPAAGRSANKAANK